jgi:hypothetical protein
MKQSRFLDYHRRPWTDALDVIARLIHEGEIQPASGRYGPATMTWMGESWAIHKVPPLNSFMRLVTDTLNIELQFLGAWPNEFSAREWIDHNLGHFNV